MKTLIFLILYLIFSTACLAETSPVAPEMAKQYITEILSQPDFKTTRVKSRLHYLGESSEKTPTTDATHPISFSFIGLIAKLFELLLWILLGIGIIVLVIYGSRWLGQLPLQKKIKQDDYTANSRLLKKEVKTAHLPLDISKQAWKLWQSGKAPAAISLLYRGAISVLTARHGLSINNGATENECLRRVKSKQPIELYNYFAGLTRTWQNIAYASLQPSETEVQRLCEQWEQYFA